MDKRKETVLHFLKATGQATLADVAAHLEVSKQGAIRHLEALEEAGLVVRSNESHARPGRPEHLYRLTAAAAEHLPHAHRELATELVQFMAAEQVERFFAERAVRVEAEMASELDGLDLAAKVHRLAEMATATGYMSEVVENKDGSFEIKHCNCPIADVAAATGHPCRHEQSMYGRLLGTEVNRTSWAAAADPTCTYVIKSK